MERQQAEMQQPGAMERMKSKLAVLTMATVGLAGAAGMAPESAHAENAQNISTIDVSVDGYPGVNPRSPSVVTDSNGKIHGVFATLGSGGGSDVRYFNCEQPCTDPDVKIVETATRSTDVAVVPMQNGKTAVFYNIDDEMAGSGAAVCENPPVCTDWTITGNWSGGKVFSLDAKATPNGNIGIAYSRASDNFRRQIRYKVLDGNNLSAISDNPVLQNIENLEKVTLDYDPTTNRPRIGWANGRDAMIAVSPNADFENTQENPNPPLITAIDTGARAKNISIVATPGGVRAAFQDNSNQEGSVLRVGSCVGDNDEQCDTNGAQSATVDNQPINGLGTSPVYLNDGSVEIVYGSTNGLKLAVCPPEYNDCNSSNYLATIDPNARARNPSFDVSGSGEAVALYENVIDEGRATELKLASGSTPTFGITLQQQQEAGSSRSNIRLNDSPKPPTIPVGTEYRVATDPRYILGKHWLELCGLATGNYKQCEDILWRPEQAI